MLACILTCTVTYAARGVRRTRADGTQADIGQQSMGTEADYPASPTKQQSVTSRIARARVREELQPRTSTPRAVFRVRLVVLCTVKGRRTTATAATVAIYNRSNCHPKSQLCASLHLASK